jgi:hyperosmotically inducible periplasmic protein
MTIQTGRLISFLAGTLLAASGLAFGQGTTDQPPLTPDPQGSLRDTAQLQGGRLDTLRMPRSTHDTYEGSSTDSSQSSVRDSSQGSSRGAVAPDNTGINKRDRDDTEVTADEQGQSAADIDVTRKIRRAIMDDDSFSTYAKNVKIVTKDGMVTLKGPVRSEQEKTSIEAKAASIAGTGKIRNQLEVKTGTEQRND